MSEAPPVRSGASLERRLPLLISGLLVAVLVLFGVAAYREVRTSAIARASDRLDSLIREIARNSAQGAARTFTLLRLRAQHPSIARALAAPADGAAALRMLGASRTTSDSTVEGWELRAMDGRAVLRWGTPASPEDSARLSAMLARWSAADSVLRSPIYPADGNANTSRFWLAAPVLVEGRAVGFLAERRRLGRLARADTQIRKLVGEDVQIWLTSVDGRDWATMSGEPVATPFEALAPVAGGSSVARARDQIGAPQLVARAVVPGTPWVFVLSERESAVLERVGQFTRRMTAIGLVLLLLGALAAWLVSRHVTSPLRRMTTAAERLAEGDFGQRVAVTGNHEIATLADTFNTMAGALAERNAALEQANKAKAKFLAMMSHELRTPLNAIAGYTELLQLGLRGPVTEAQVEDLVRIRRNKDHLLSIIADILNFARLDAGQLELRMTEFPVRAAFRDVEDMMRAQFAEKGLRFVVRAPEPELLVRADREKLQQILLNLLTNALRFTDEGGWVTLSAGQEGALVEIEVRDSGVGIAADQLQAIFEPFVQVDSSLTRRVGGTGLGLPIARDLATAMGGDVAVSSREGEGSRFIVRLPAGPGWDRGGVRVGSEWGQSRSS